MIVGLISVALIQECCLHFVYMRRTDCRAPLTRKGLIVGLFWVIVGLISEPVSTRRGLLVGVFFWEMNLGVVWWPEV